jgi:hypothetical protein
MLLSDPIALGRAVMRGEVGFDDAVGAAWDAGASRGLFRYPFDQAQRRRSLRRDGSPGRFWVQCNPGRSARRAPPRSYEHVVQPFEPGAFHFASGHIRPDEVLMELVAGAVQVSVLLNVSPFGHRHCVVVIDPAARHPQLLELQGGRAALALLALSGRDDLKLGFNSLAGCASVNHYHFQMLYFRGGQVEQDLMPSELAQTEPTAAPGVSRLADYPVQGWRFAGEEPELVARQLARAARVLQQLDVAHNVLLGRRGAVLVPRAAQQRVAACAPSGLAFLELHGEMLVTGPCGGPLDQNTADETLEQQLGRLRLGAGEFEALERAIVREALSRDTSG